MPTYPCAGSRRQGRRPPRRIRRRWLGRPIARRLEREVERGALPWRRTNPQLPALAFDDATAHSQPSARTTTVNARRVQPPEDPEDVFLLLGWDADAIVTNVESAHRPLTIGWHSGLAADLHPAWRLGRGVLYAVADQIDQHLLQPDAVTGNGAEAHRTA